MLFSAFNHILCIKNSYQFFNVLHQQFIKNILTNCPSFYPLHSKPFPTPFPPHFTSHVCQHTRIQHSISLVPYRSVYSKTLITQLAVQTALNTHNYKQYTGCVNKRH